MALHAPSIKSPPPLLCDWAEFKAIASSNHQFRLNTLRRLWDTSRETEESDPEGLGTREADTDQDAIAGSDEDRFFDSVVGEIEERQRILGSSYPFRLETGSRLVLVGPPTDGRLHVPLLPLSYIYQWERTARDLAAVRRQPRT